jgi:hypothetical protein
MLLEVGFKLEILYFLSLCVCESHKVNTIITFVFCIYKKCLKSCIKLTVLSIILMLNQNIQCRKGKEKKTHTLTIFIKIYNSNISAKKVVQYYYKKNYTTCL